MRLAVGASKLLAKVYSASCDDIKGAVRRYDSMTFGRRITPRYYGTWLSAKSIAMMSGYISIHPNDIQLQTKHGEVPFIEGGNWDECYSDFVPHASIFEMLNEKKSWHQTSQYQLMTAQVEAGKIAYGCKTKEDVELHGELMLASWKSVKKNGYVQQGYQSTESLYPNDILISIGRTGELFLERNGTHRLTVAKYFDLESVLAFVIRVHPDYLDTNELDFSVIL
jgi:hypothetical protein